MANINHRRAQFEQMIQQLRDNSADIVRIRRHELPLPFTDIDAINFAIALEHNTHVQEVDLVLSHLTERKALLLAGVVSREGTPIRKVVLFLEQPNNAFLTHSAAVLRAFLSLLMTSTKLRSFGIHSFSDGLMDHTAASVRELLLVRDTVDEICFAGCPVYTANARDMITDGIAKSSTERVCFFATHPSMVNACVRGLENNDRCQTLYVMCDDIDDIESYRSIRKFLENPRKSSIKVLTFDWPERLPVDMWPILVGLKKNTTISCLKIKYGSLSPHNAMLLARLFQSRYCSIKKLALIACTFSGEAFSIVMRSLYRNRTVKELTFDSNRLSDLSCSRQLLELICWNKSIKTLQVIKNPELTSFVDSDLVNEWANVRGRPSQLETLVLSGIGFGPDRLDNLMQCLRSPLFANLRNLRLGSNGIDGRGCQRLVAFLTQTRGRGLQELKLSRNPIGMEGSEALAGLLLQHPTILQHLYLDETRIGDKGLAAIASAVRGHASSGLKTLSVIDNEFGDVGLRALSSTLPACKSLRQLRLTLSSDVSAEAKESFVGALEQNESITKHEIHGITEDDQFLEKIRFYRTRNACLLPLVTVSTGSASPPSLWPHALARCGGSSTLDASYRSYIIRSFLAGILENQVETSNSSGGSLIRSRTFNFVLASVCFSVFVYCDGELVGHGVGIAASCAFGLLWDYVVTHLMGDLGNRGDRGIRVLRFVQSIPFVAACLVWCMSGLVHSLH